MLEIDVCIGRLNSATHSHSHSHTDVHTITPTYTHTYTHMHTDSQVPPLLSLCLREAACKLLKPWQLLVQVRRLLLPPLLLLLLLEVGCKRCKRCASVIMERGVWETKAEVSVCCVCVECFAKGERGVGDKGGGECVLRLR